LKNTGGDHVVLDWDKDMGDILVLGGVQKMMGADIEATTDCLMHP
jgi:hypothetical protein